MTEPWSKQPIPHQEPTGGTVTLEAARPGPAGALRRALRVLGPGFITGASDDDPSGIGTYASIGAAFGFAALWLAPASFPLMAAVQFICAKVGMVCGTGLAGVLRRHYPRGVLYPAVVALVAANTINAGVDIGAIAAGINLLIPLPISVLIVPISVVILTLQLWGSYRLIARTFKWLTLALFAYIGAAYFAHPDWSAVVRGTLVPTMRLDEPFLMALVAVLGTTISPYLFFWQASEEVEEEISAGRTEEVQRQGATDAELRIAAWDVDLGMFFSNVVMYFIILATAATLHAAGQTEIGSAAEAARALEPLAGRAAKALLALGLIGAGFLAVPILTGAGAYAAAEAWGWRYGLDEKPRQAKPFYAVIVGATLVGMLINFIGINPITALYWTAVLNGLLAPPLLVLIMLMANNRAVMGARTNGRLLNALGWAATAAMTAAAAGLLGAWL
jgi:NRAMP (natural resistance-associated macrophage protein)-like metal ion transporter